MTRILFIFLCIAGTGSSAMAWPRQRQVWVDPVRVARFEAAKAKAAQALQDAQDLLDEALSNPELQSSNTYWSVVGMRHHLWNQYYKLIERGSREYYQRCFRPTWPTWQVMEEQAFVDSGLCRL